MNNRGRNDEPSCSYRCDDSELCRRILIPESSFLPLISDDRIVSTFGLRKKLFVTQIFKTWSYFKKLIFFRLNEYCYYRKIYVNFETFMIVADR